MGSGLEAMVGRRRRENGIRRATPKLCTYKLCDCECGCGRDFDRHCEAKVNCVCCGVVVVAMFLDLGCYHCDGLDGDRGNGGGGCGDGVLADGRGRNNNDGECGCGFEVLDLFLL